VLNAQRQSELHIGDKTKLEAFEDAVIDRLFAFNAKRAHDETVEGLGAGSANKTAPAKRGPAKKFASAEGARKPRRVKKGDVQLALDAKAEGRE
jgi:hypothetical protein